jgi:hypothetical protein
MCSKCFYLNAFSEKCLPGKIDGELQDAFVFPKDPPGLQV